MKKLNTTSFHHRLPALLLLGLLLLAAAPAAWAQTCTGNITLTTQAQVNAFNCTTVTGNLTIQGAGITNLNGLSELTTVGGFLRIGSNSSLTNVDGLSSLSSIGGLLQINFNSGLTNVDGLSSLSSIGGFLHITSNSSLTNVDGLSSLSTIGGYLQIGVNSSLTNVDGLSSLSSIGGYLQIYENSSLTNVDGLSSLSAIGEYLEIYTNSSLTNVDGLSSLSSLGGYLFIQDNSSLTNVDGLSSLSSIGGDLYIISNSSLTDCCGVYPLINTPGAVGGGITISNNDTGCDSETEINEACAPNNTPPVAICQALTVDADAYCQAMASAEDFNNGSSDPDEDELSFSVSPEGPYALGTTNVTLTVSDGEESSTCETTITVEDNTDSDGDGTEDCNDGCPNDPGKVDPGVCGCGLADADSDNDGLPDCIDACPYDPYNDSDGDGVCGDLDNCPSTANASQADSDCDGTGDACDLCDGGDDSVDNNHDGLPDCAYPPAFEDIIEDWKCGNGNNQKVLVCHKGNKTNCISINALAAHIGHGDYLGPCGGADCGGAARVAPGGVVAAQSGEALQLEAMPNPFSEQVSFRYYLPADGRVQLSILSIHGQEVAKVVDGQQAAGLQRLEWRNDAGLPAGLYFARLQTELGVRTLQLVVAK